MATGTLTKGEQDTLDRLLAKANAGTQHAPAVRVGDEYVALVNLSLPRRDNRPADKDYVPQCDLVRAGDTVYLTPEEAASFNRHDPVRDGRRIPVVVKRSELEQWQRVHPSLMSGPVRTPPQPPNTGEPAPRPDPPGSSRIIETTVPEGMPVYPGAETGGAMDITAGLPGGGPDPRSGADRDLIAAVKSGMAVKK